MKNLNCLRISGHTYDPAHKTTQLSNSTTYPSSPVHKTEHVKPQQKKKLKISCLTENDMFFVTPQNSHGSTPRIDAPDRCTSRRSPQRHCARQWALWPQPEGKWRCGCGKIWKWGLPWYIPKTNKNGIQSAKMRINQRIKNGDSFAVQLKPNIVPESSICQQNMRS